jgi:YVTN family beta-propeller protein
VGTNPLGLALSPDGRYAIVSNDEAESGGLTVPSSEPGLVAGYSLAVVDTQTMKVVSVYHDSSTSFFMGVATARDPSDPSRTLVLASDAKAGVIRILDLDASGQLTAEQQAIALPASSGRRPFPAEIAVAPNNRIAYVADNLGDSLIAIDLASRSAVRTIPVGDFPLYVAVNGASVIASGSGLSAYAAIDPPTAQPQFAAPIFDPAKASSLTLLDLDRDGGTIGDPATVPMDPAPDGNQIIGGAAPGAMVLSRQGNLAYVALANVDRVAVVSLTAPPRVVRGLDLRLYPGAPYGATPSAEALSPDGKRLYVALAGLNAVAVLDARRPTRYRYGLIPTAWYPTALSLSGNGRYLYVADSKGVDGWGILQRIDLKHTALIKATLAALRYNRTPAVATFNPVIPPLRSNKRSEAIDHVVYVATGTQTYDAMFGDLKDAAGAAHGNGNEAFNLYPESVTPNFHALARAYAIADNFYGADADPDVAAQFATGADATLYAQLVAAFASARTPMDGRGDDPEDYGRAGYLFNALQRAGLTFRDYGGLLGLSGYDSARYHLDVPALAALRGNVDPYYPVDNPKADNAARAAEFVRDMQNYVQADGMPSFTYVRLAPATSRAGVADTDRALGTIVDFISHTPHWSSTVIFIVPSGTRGADHVNAMRSYALVVSPLAKRGYVGHKHLSVPSIVKTEEEIFGLPPLTLNDLLASDLSDFFAEAPTPEPYQAIR